MPVIAVGAAIAADVIAGAAVAGTVGGIAAISTVTAFEVVAAVGATLAAVGTITRDKTLTMVGGAIGLVGGIGGLASSAGVFGAAAAGDAPLFGVTPGSGASTGATFADSLTPATAGTMSGGVDAGVWDATAGMSVADAASANTIPFVAGTIPEGQDGLITLSSVSERATDPAATLTETTPATATATTNGLDPAKDLTALNDPTKGTINQQPGATGDLINPPPAPPSSLGTTDPATGQTITSAVDPATGKIVSLPDKPSTFGSILKFANDNKTLVSGVMTVGGKLLEGAFSELDPAKINALNAQAAANDAAAALTRQQTANLAMPKAVASSTPVTGTPGAIIPPRPQQGLINQAQLAPVTGAPV